LNKKTLSEADICAKFITPALNRAGWSEVEQVFRDYTLRPGRVVVQGSHSRRDKRSILRADYALFYKTGMALAVIEAKDMVLAAGRELALRADNASGAERLLAMLPERPAQREALASQGRKTGMRGSKSRRDRRAGPGA
jgi:type I site-specific restriction endonuclease